MNERLSKTQIDKLGERLKSEQPSEADLQLLDRHRRSFSDAYEIVVRAIREQLGLEPTGRPAKTIPSIREKLRRESIRLTQIQDIAGCRVVVRDIAEQERVVHRLRDLFPQARVVDRRVVPSFGYRAVHVVPTNDGRHVEIQVRTSLQQRWAEISERYSDLDPDIKYGGGNQEIGAMLLQLSDGAYLYEKLSGDESLVDEEFRQLKEQYPIILKTIEDAGPVGGATTEGQSRVDAKMIEAEQAHLKTRNALRASERDLVKLFDDFSAAIEDLKR